MSLLSTQREWKRSFPGVATEVRSARTWLLTHTRLIDIGSDVAERAAFLLSELASNAVVHTVSGQERGMFQVTLRIESTILRVEVTDQGNSHSLPRPMKTDPWQESGRGLTLVEYFALRWGYSSGPNGRTVFAEITHQDTEPSETGWNQISRGQGTLQG